MEAGESTEEANEESLTYRPESTRGESELKLSVMRWSHKLGMLSMLALLLSCSAIPPHGNLPADLIPPGMRAVKILVDEDISLALGDRVNVLMMDKAQTNITVLENVAVMAADQKLRVATLLVSPQDAQRITDAGEQGRLSLRLWKSD